MTTRGNFILKLVPTVALGAGISVAALQARAAPVPAHAAATDTVAAQLGYRHDATKVNKKKYPTWVVCAALGGKAVNGKGWCHAWVKMA